MLSDFLFFIQFSLFIEQATSGIGHRVKQFSRVGNHSNVGWQFVVGLHMDTGIFQNVLPFYFVFTL